MRHPPRFSTWRRVLAYSVLIAILWSWQTLAHSEQSSSEFEVFLAADGVAGHGQPNPREEDAWVDADVILGVTRGQFRVFGDYFLDPAKHDLERFQVGYEVVPDTVIWLGRFQQPASAWDTEHHRERYLQTAITRPAVENWEDEDGLIPQHITGMLVESRRPAGGTAGLQLSASAGADPSLEPEHSEPIDLVGNNPGRHGVSFKGRLAYLPSYAGNNSAGLLLGHDQLFASSLVAIGTLRSYHVVLTTYGAYLDFTLTDWRIIGAAYYFDVELDHPNPDESFMSGYLQAERHLPHDLTAFFRVEDSARIQHSRYVAQLDDASTDLDIAIRRQSGGLRWDFASRQALTVEVGHEDSLDRHGNEVRIQWSAAVR